MTPHVNNQKILPTINQKVHSGSNHNCSLDRCSPFVFQSAKQYRRNHGNKSREAQAASLEFDDVVSVSGGSFGQLRADSKDILQQQSTSSESD